MWIWLFAWIDPSQKARNRDIPTSANSNAKLNQSLKDPSTAEIAKAVALNDAFVDGLERLKDMAIIARGGNVSSNHH